MSRSLKVLDILVISVVAEVDAVQDVVMANEIADVRRVVRISQVILQGVNEIPEAIILIAAPDSSYLREFIVARKFCG